MAVLDLMMTLDRSNVIVNFIENNGYLRQLATSLSEDNNLLLDDKNALAQLELYHSKMVNIAT